MGEIQPVSGGDTAGLWERYSRSVGEIQPVCGGDTAGLWKGYSWSVGRHSRSVGSVGERKRERERERERGRERERERVGDGHAGRTNLQRSDKNDSSTVDARMCFREDEERWVFQKILT